MRKATAQILANLCASHSKRALIGLWADLQTLTKAEFEKAIEEAPKSNGAKNKKRGMAGASAVSDRPASRITHLMLEKCDLSASGAVEALREQLATQGIAISRIPALRGNNFEAWLSTLFRTVPSSHVLHAAVTLAERRVS
ncbi:MAG: hypothetical protein ACKVP3_29070 [Hyphomicrobiaceae bacterium]